MVNYLANGNDVVLDMKPYMENELIGLGKTFDPNDDAKSVDDPTTKKDTLNANFLQEGQHYIKEGTYSLPWYKNSEALFYNSDVLDKELGSNYNLTNWEDIISIAKKLKNKNI